MSATATVKVEDPILSTLATYDLKPGRAEMVRDLVAAEAAGKTPDQIASIVSRVMSLPSAASMLKSSSSPEPVDEEPMVTLRFTARDYEKLQELNYTARSIRGELDPVAELARRDVAEQLAFERQSQQPAEPEPDPEPVAESAAEVVPAPPTPEERAATEHESMKARVRDVFAMNRAPGLGDGGQAPDYVFRDHARPANPGFAGQRFTGEPTVPSPATSAAVAPDPRADLLEQTKAIFARPAGAFGR